MHIHELHIENFRGVKRAHFDKLDSMVVLAGPNGCGKSAVLDAIRLLKSSYGGYSQNEWQQWFGEFQIPLNTPSDLLPLFRNRQAPIGIEAVLGLAEAEIAFLRANGRRLIRQLLRRATRSADALENVGLALEDRLESKRLEDEAAAMLTQLEADLTNRATFDGSFTIDTDLETHNAESVVLEVLFGTYQPDNLGVIDYHGPHRNYGRERISQIRLNVTGPAPEARAQHALYNYGQKYGNIKSEMAATYVRELIAEKHGSGIAYGKDLTATLHELFQLFFPGKRFAGPQPSPDGHLTFPVLLEDASSHDINELSSGEKEVLFGYLRLRNASPTNSIILLDEPELH